MRALHDATTKTSPDSSSRRLFPIGLGREENEQQQRQEPYLWVWTSRLSTARRQCLQAPWRGTLHARPVTTRWRKERRWRGVESTNRMPSGVAAGCRGVGQAVAVAVSIAGRRKLCRPRLVLPRAARRRRATTTASPKCVHCANWNDQLNRLKLTVTSDTYMKTLELFVKSKVPLLTLTLTRSAKIEKTAIPPSCTPVLSLSSLFWWLFDLYDRSVDRPRPFTVG